MTDMGSSSYGDRANQDSLAAVLLTSRLVSDNVKPLSASKYWEQHELACQPSALLGKSQEALRQDHGLSADMAAQIAALTDRATAMAFELDRLQQSGIHTLTPFDENYPCQFQYRLKNKAPVVLHAAGPLDLLGRLGLGVVGSRDVNKVGADVAKEAARVATRMGLPVVSGGARGVDRLAMNAALGEEGTSGFAVGFLADSMERQLKNPSTRRAIHEGHALLCTPYRPDARFTAGTAMARNKLIYAGALVTLVVASDKDTGGTWAGAVEALKFGFGPVAVWRGPGEGPGNEHLEQKGAAPVRSLDGLEALLLDAQEKSETAQEPNLELGEPRLPFPMATRK